MRGYIAFASGYFIMGTYTVIKTELELKKLRAKIKST